MWVLFIVKSIELVGRNASERCNDGARVANVYARATDSSSAQGRATTELASPDDDVFDEVLRIMKCPGGGCYEHNG